MGMLEEFDRFINRLLVWFAAFFIVIMVVLSCANIFMRIIWKPILGTYELLGFFGAVSAALALGYTHMKRGHIAVDILVSRFSRRTQTFVNALNSLILMILFAIVTWHIGKYAKNLWLTGELTETLQIIYYPFAYCMAFGCAVLGLVFLSDFLKIIFSKKGGFK